MKMKMTTKTSTRRNNEGEGSLKMMMKSRDSLMKCLRICSPAGDAQKVMQTEMRDARSCFIGLVFVVLDARLRLAW